MKTSFELLVHLRGCLFLFCSDVAAIIASADVVMTVYELVLMVELLWLGLQLGKNLRLVLSLLLQNRLLLEHHLLGMRDSPASEDFWESKRHCST